MLMRDSHCFIKHVDCSIIEEVQINCTVFVVVVFRIQHLPTDDNKNLFQHCINFFLFAFYTYLTEKQNVTTI